MDAQKEEIIGAYTSQSYQQCLDLFNALPADAQNTSELQILKASCLINLDNQIPEAHRILDEILAVDADNSFAIYARGLALLKQQKLVESVACFARAADLDTAGIISNAQVMKLQTEELLRKSQRKSRRSSPKTNADGTKKSILCEICNKIFAQQYSLNRHRKIHSREHAHKCAACPSSFRQKSDLTRHTKAVHSEAKAEDRGKHACDVCGKEFKYKKLMKLHKVTHSTRQKLNCDFCEKIFVTKPSLKAHIMSHITRMSRLAGKAPAGTAPAVKAPAVKAPAITTQKASEKIFEDIEQEINASRISKPSASEPKTPKMPQQKVLNPVTVKQTHDSKRIKLEAVETEQIEAVLPPTPASTPPPQTESMLSPQSESATVNECVGDSEMQAPEWNFFFKSLLHDLGKMDDRQKRKFRLRTFSLIDEILE